jgi:ATP-dependent DNA helicase RecG
LRLLTTYQGRKVPTVGGVLLFGREREPYFPDAWIQAGRFHGKKKTVIADSSEIRSLPVKAVEEAIEFVEKHAFKEADIGRLHRTDRWSVPPKALREAVVNAVVHCDYSQRGAPIRLMIFDDRVEIENPGLLPFGLTIDDLRDGISKLRNRVVGRVFHELRLIERWGSGIQRMTQACLEAGLPPPLLEEKAARFRVTIFTQLTGPSQLDPIDKTIVDALDEANGLPTSQIASRIGLTTRATRTRLVRLVELGLVREIGTGPRDPKRRYYKAR